MKKNHISMIILMMLLSISLPVTAIDYQLPDMQGTNQSLTQYRGKWLVVNFWASWCRSCRKEFAELASLHEAYKEKDIVIVGINHEDISLPQLRAFVKDHNIPYQILSSKPDLITPLGKVPALPTTYIIDPKGKIIAGEVGVISRENLESYISKQKKLASYHPDPPDDSQ